MKSMNIGISVVGRSNQFFNSRFLNWKKIQKNEVFTGKQKFFTIDPFCTPRSICLKIDFWQDSFVWMYKCTSVSSELSFVRKAIKVMSSIKRLISIQMLTWL